MALTKQFSNRLDSLWKRRTATLRALVVPRGVGQPPKFSRQVRDRLINDLLDDATKLLLEQEGHTEFKTVAPHRRLMQIRGHGLLKRGSNMLKWARVESQRPDCLLVLAWEKVPLRGQG